MANDVINPYQTLRDNRGKPLAAGKLKVYVNRTTSIGTAFSDSDLTIAQSVDPYVLDNYGRVAGDLRWSGERTVEVYDADDALIRTLNDVVTLVDTSGFAINFASVAAMAADSTLLAGDVCETQSYNLDQRQGGASYIVTTSAETVDNYRVIDLAPAGLQARLLNEEKNKNFYVAGALGDGTTDDSAVINVLLAIGGNIECSEGTFRCNNLALSTSARIHGNGTLKLTQYATNDLLALSGADLFIWLDGITLDGDSANQLAEAATDLVSSAVTATTGNSSVISFTNCTFDNPTLYAVHGDAADDGQSVLYSFGTCRFLGGLEATATPYIPAYINLTDGASGLVEDCYFDFEATPGVVGGRAGVITSNTAFLNPGYLSVADCTFNRIGADPDSTNMLGSIHARGIKQLIVADNRILTPQVAGVVWGSEVDSVQVSGNLVDSLIGTDKLGGLVALVTTETTPGNNWQIQDNQLVGILLANPIRLDGGSGGVDVADVSISGNLIDTPTAVAISLENIDGLDIRGNYINMDAGAYNGIEIDTDGVSGVVTIQDNTLINIQGTALELAVGTSAIYQIDGNTFETITAGIGINVDNCATAIITNNSMDEVATILVALGATVATAVVDGNTYTGTAPTSYITDAGVTALTYGNNFQLAIDSSIVAITGAAIDITAHYHTIADTTTVTSATFAADIIGWEVTILSSVAVTMTDSATMLLAGNFVMSADDTLTMVWDGSAFVETARSAN